MTTNQPNTTDHRDIDAASIPADSAGEAAVSAERALLSDARLVLALVNEARYPILRRMFGVSRAQVNILTLILALSAADATYALVRRFIRDPWPLDGPDTAIGAFVVREAGFSLAGPQAREGQLFGILIVVAGIGSLIHPGVRRTLHSLHVAEQRVGQQRMRIYGAAQRALADEPKREVR